MKTRKIFSAVILTFLLTMLCGMMSMAATTIVPKTTNNVENGANGASNYTLSMAAGQTQAIYPVKVASKGRVCMDFAAAGVSGSVRLGLYSNSACTQEVGYGGYISASGLTDQMQCSVTKGGTYYLKLSRSSYNATAAVKITAKTYFYNGADRALSNNVWAGSYGVDSNAVTYYKVAVNKTGYITLDGYSYSSYLGKGSVSVTLYNSSKKAVSSYESIAVARNDKAVFGVKKGTYYIGVKTSGLYALKCNFTAVSDKNISSKKKAASLKKGKTGKGLFVAGESGSKTDWYKFTLTKEQKVKITLNVKSSGYIRVQIVPASKNVSVSGSISQYGIGKDVGSTRGKLPKGKYYLKVTKSNSDKNISGYYTVKWK